MARIIINDSIFKDNRFIELLIKLGWGSAHARCAYARLDTTQKWSLTPEEGIPAPEWYRWKMSPYIIDVGLAEVIDGKVIMKGIKVDRLTINAWCNNAKN